MRILACSNSSPASVAAPTEALRPDGAGGLVPHMLSLLGDAPGDWVFADAAPRPRAWPTEVNGVGLHPVVVSPDHRRQHYETISIDTLQRLFHYLHDTGTDPLFDAGLHAAWHGYRAVNLAFADRLATVPTPSVVLVNDYHLMLLPGVVRRVGLPDDVPLVYSHGVPWCEPDYFAVLPGPIRVEILTSLLACDRVVFHSSRWRAAFARCCDAFVPEAEIDEDHVDFRGRRTRLIVAPFPLDTAGVSRLRHAEGTRRWSDTLARRAGGRRLVVRVERLDLWKNHLRGFAAYESVVARHPGLVDEVWLLAVTARPRYRSARHLAYEAACLAAVDRINAAHARPGRPEPVTMFGLDVPGNARERAVAALHQASVVLINPTYEGFGLVAKEAALLAGDAPLLVSTTAGAYEELASTMTPVDPFDVVGTADVLEAAVAGGASPDARERQRWRERIRTQTARDWMSRVLADDADDAHAA
jgi:trehalose 6-phosphate synthase